LLIFPEEEEEAFVTIAPLIDDLETKQHRFRLSDANAVVVVVVVVVIAALKVFFKAETMHFLDLSSPDDDATKRVLSPAPLIKAPRRLDTKDARFMPTPLDDDDDRAEEERPNMALDDVV
jgi:hypothetical protein